MPPQCVTFVVSERGNGRSVTRGRLQPAEDREPAIHREDRWEEPGPASS